MTKRGIRCVALLGCLLSVECFASANHEASKHVPGLTVEDENYLNGVWEEMNTLDSQAKADRWKSTWNFSWGKGRLTQIALVIDLTAKEPEIQLIGVFWVDVLSVSKPEPFHYIFTTRNKYARDPERKNVKVIDSVDIRLHADGTITCISSFEADSVVIDQGQYHFFRTYGPGISQ